MMLFWKNSGNFRTKFLKRNCLKWFEKTSKICIKVGPETAIFFDYMHRFSTKISSPFSALIIACFSIN